MFQPIDLKAFLIFSGVAILCAILSRLLIKYSFVAMPNARSAHHTPVATAGGLALVLSITAGLLFLVLFEDVGGNSVLVLLGLSSLAALLGLVDDAREILAKVKFGSIGVLSIIMAGTLGPVLIIPFDHFQINLPWVVGLLGTALWAFTVINTVNFIDGADGVIPLSTLIACLGLSVLAALFGVWIVCWSGLLLVSALIGFLPFNMPRARLFLGDTGSLFIGTWFAGAALILIDQGPSQSLWLMPLLIMPWLSDVLLTMAWRLKHRFKLLTPHKDHLYQWVLQEQKSHFPVAIGMGLQTAAAALLAVLFRSSATSAFLGFCAAASLAVLVHWQIRANARNQNTSKNYE